MTTEVFTTSIKEGNHIRINIEVYGKEVSFIIGKGDVGFSVDAIGATGELVEMGWLSDCDDLDLFEEDED